MHVLPRRCSHPSRTIKKAGRGRGRTRGVRAITSVFYTPGPSRSDASRRRAALGRSPRSSSGSSIQGSEHAAGVQSRLVNRCAPSRPCSFAAERHQQRASAWDSVATQRGRPAGAPHPPPLHTCRPTLPTQRACHGRATVGRHATLAREASVESGQGPPPPSHPCQLTDLHVPCHTGVHLSRS